MVQEEPSQRFLLQIEEYKTNFNTTTTYLMYLMYGLVYLVHVWVVIVVLSTSRTCAYAHDHVLGIHEVYLGVCEPTHLSIKAGSSASPEGMDWRVRG